MGNILLVVYSIDLLHFDIDMNKYQPIVSTLTTDLYLNLEEKGGSNETSVQSICIGCDSDFDLFCGSGQSQWSDPNAPGAGEFFCAPIRIVVDSVIRNPDQTNASTEGSIDLSQQRLQVAQELYGTEQAGCWLGLQDVVQACKGSGSTCIFNFSGACTSNNGVPPAITLPTATP